MSLKSGTYTIFSKAYDFPVSRHFIEDRSLNPKRVLTLPRDFLPRLLKWELELLHNGNYILRVGKHTADISGLLFAVLLDKPEATEWKIEPVFHQGHNTYLITEAKEPGKGWIVPDEEPETQIAIKHLIVHPSEPPVYPHNELFVITPAE